MRWTIYGFRAGCAIAIVLCVASVAKLAGYYGDVREAKQQLEAARDIYRESALDEPAPAPASTFVPMPDAAYVAMQEKLPFGMPAESPRGLVVQDRFKPLLRTNADVIGWLKIDGTTIDYPVLQADDNAYYLKKDLYRNDNVTGSIFMDYRNHIDQAERHWIVYGHYMKDEIMFKGLLKYRDEAYYREHPLIEFDTLYGDREWLIFSAYDTNANEDYIRTAFSDDDRFGAFAEGLKASSLYDTGISIGPDDTVLTLSTCSRAEESGRFTVHAKLISEPA